MNANPLVSPSAAPKAGTPDKNKSTITLVSNAPAADISGLGEFLAVFNAGEAHAEISHFRYIIQRRVKRAMGGKFAKGLSTEVTENIEININEDLFGLRRWLGAVRQDPASIMLLNIFKIKEDSLAAPLTFSEMLRTGRPLLVTGADASIRAQLVTTADLKFQTIPKEIARDEGLKQSLVARVQRRKGFIQTVRNLLDFEIFHPEVHKKLSSINTGGDPSSLSEAEIVNICLISDTASRYRMVLDHFRTVMEKGSVQVPQMIAMFEMVTSDIPINHAAAAFKEFLGEEAGDPAKIATKGMLFGHIYRALSKDEGTREGRADRMSRFHKAVGSAVIRTRVRVDPFLWKKCHFLGNREGSEKKIIEGMRPFCRALTQAVKAGEEGITEVLRKQTALQMFELMEAGAPPKEGGRRNPDQGAQRVAAELLGLLSPGNGHATDPSNYLGEGGQAPANAEEFIKKFMGLPLKLEDLRQAAGRLRYVVYLNEMVTAEIQRSSLDVLKKAAGERNQTLRDIYVVNAVSELTNFTFHMGEQKLNNLDRICSIGVAANRLGLEINQTPATDTSIGLFAEEGEPPLGDLRNEGGLLRLAYTELVGMRVEDLVKRMVDRKINFLQTTFGKNFFEVLYNGVVTKNNMPISRNQFATFITRRRILGNLDGKGWNPSKETELNDPYLLFVDNPAEIRKDEKAAGELKGFKQKFSLAANNFKQLLNETRASATEDPTDFNPNLILWGLFKQGIYDLNRAEAKAAFRKSIFFKHLQELIAKISSENYSTFAGGVVDSGIRIFIPWKFNYLQLIGDRFGFLMGERVVKYQLLPSPTEKPEELDDVSRVMYLQLEQIFNAEEKEANVQAVQAMGDTIEKTNRIWNEYSRGLAISVMDRALSETVIKQLEPGKIGINNLWYLPDSRKLCLGKSVTSADTVPFAKVLQFPENMGNVLKNPKSSSTTIDDFTIQMHSIGRLRDELWHVSGIADDALDILQNLSYDRREGPAMSKYELALQNIVKVLSKPLRHLSEKDVQLLHALAKQIRDLLYSLYNSPSLQKHKITNRLQAELQARRSDGHSVKLNFSDAFIIDTTEIKVMQKTGKDGESVRKQKKVEVEVEASHQTLPLRMRDVIRTQQILQKKQHVVFSPEGQKKKQTEYMLDIIEILQALKGNALTFHVDTSSLAEDQVHRLARRIKPHNFFAMDDVKAEPPPGMKVTIAIDPLSGRPVPVPTGDAQPQRPPQPGQHG